MAAPMVRRTANGRVSADKQQHRTEEEVRTQQNSGRGLDHPGREIKTPCISKEFRQ
jgi:hypothetical protein